MNTNTKMNTITTTQIHAHCTMAWNIGATPMFLGAPGIGKSEAVLAAATQRAAGRTIVNTAAPGKDEYGYIDLRLALYETVDVGGLPYITEVNGVKVQQRAMFNLLPRSGEGTLFIDEVAQCDMSMQRIVGQLVWERRIGDYVLPDGWVLVLAGNRREDRSGANEILAHLVNRTIPYTVVVDVDGWLQWAASHNIAPEVCAFIKWQPALLHKMPEARAGNVPFASPRQWSVVSRALKSGALTNAMEGPTYSALVGDEAAAGFLAFLATYRTLPDLDKALKDPDNAPTPDGLAAQFAALAALTRRVNAAPKVFANVLRYVERFASPEFAVTLVRLVKGNAASFDAIKDSPAYGGFIARNKDLFIGA